MVQKSTAEIAEVAGSFITPKIADTTVIAIASFFINNRKLQVFRVSTNSRKKCPELDKWEKYC